MINRLRAVLHTVKNPVRRRKDFFLRAFRFFILFLHILGEGIVKHSRYEPQTSYTVENRSKFVSAMPIRRETVKDKTGSLVFSPEELERVIRENYEDIYRYCYWRVKNSADAQDLTQETFLRFAQSLSRYTEQGKRKNLLYTIARNLCIDLLRQRSRLVSLELDENNAGEGPDALETLEERLTLRKLLEELPEEQQEMLLLRYGLELPVHEIARLTQKNRFAVRYRIKTGLDALKRKLNEGGYTE